MGDELLLTDQVAEDFRVTTQTVRNWIKRGLLPAEKYGHVFRVRREDAAAFAGRHSDVVAAAARHLLTEGAPQGTRRDVWDPETLELPRRRSRRSPRAGRAPTVWDSSGVPALRRKHS